MTSTMTVRASFVSLSDREIAILQAAGGAADPMQRQQAVGIVLAKSGDDERRAREILGASYLEQTQPSFHLIPRGDAMADEVSFTAAYARLAEATSHFTVADRETLAGVLDREPTTLAPLRMILGLTHNELAVAIRTLNPELRTTGGSVKKFERPEPGAGVPAAASAAGRRRSELIGHIVTTVEAVLGRTILQVPDAVAEQFHSKLDKRDTRDGWTSVAADAGGVPYSALLYQRYVGGVWRQVQDAYSEVKGDAVLEYPLRDLLIANGIAHHHTKSGAAGAAETAARYGLSPGPDFVIPDESPLLVIESKVGEDGGTVRDKAARIRAMTIAANSKGLKPCALVDGKGWSERVNALVDVVIATQGRTYSLSTIDHVLELPEIRALST